MHEFFGLKNAYIEQMNDKTFSREEKKNNLDFLDGWAYYWHDLQLIFQSTLRKRFTHGVGRVLRQRNNEYCFSEWPSVL